VTTGAQGGTDIPSGLIEAVAHLVGTGPVPLGGYTLAEIDAVSGVVHFLEEEPSPEVVAEAVRSLAARNLITTAPGSNEVQVRGDLGIALAFQQRSRVVLDARATGTAPDRPWRFVLMPQPEGVTLEILIDALGIHFYALRATGEAFARLWGRLPAGDRGPNDADADRVLEACPRTALVSVSRYDDSGDRTTHDVVLAAEGEVCHVFMRDPESPARLVAQGFDEEDWRGLVERLAATA
jgi:hypothetical protein